RKKDQISLLVDESEKLVDVFSQKESTLSKVKKSVGVGLKVKELYDAKEEIIDYVKEGRRIASRWAYGISSISDFIFAGSARRKKVLINDKDTPAYDLDQTLLDVDSGDDRYFKHVTNIAPSQFASKKSAGWGEIIWSFYGSFLNYLEKRGRALMLEYPGIHFPVFAIGYNWMLSNEISSKRVVERLAEFKQQILASDKRGITEDDIKFIFI